MTETKSSAMKRANQFETMKVESAKEEIISFISKKSRQTSIQDFNFQARESYYGSG